MPVSANPMVGRGGPQVATAYWGRWLSKLMTFPHWSVFWPRRTRQVRTGTVNADLLTRKGPALGRASSISFRCASGLGSAGAIDVCATLSLLDAPGRFIGNAHRHLGNSLVGVD